MTAMLAAELLKLRTTRTFVALVGAALVLSLGLTALIANEDSGTGAINAEPRADFSTLFILVLGILGMAGEWRHRTIAGSLLAAPDRVRFVASKMLAYAIAGVVLAVVVTVASMLLSAAWAASNDAELVGVGDAISGLWRNFVLAAYYGALGVVLGTLVRNQAAAIVGILAWLFIAEPLLIALLEDVGRFGPLLAVSDAFSVEGSDALADDSANLLSPGQAFLVMLAWAGAGFAAAAVTVERRDV